MFLDTLIIIFFLCTILIGYHKGGIHQLMGILSIGLSFILARPLGMTFYEWLIARRSDPLPHIIPLLIILSGLFLYILFKFISRFFETGVLAANEEFLKSNQFIGACVGFINGLLMVLVFVWGIDLGIALYPNLERADIDLFQSSQIFTSISVMNPWLDVETISQWDDVYKTNKIQSLKRFHSRKHINGSSDRPRGILQTLFSRYLYNRYQDPRFQKQIEQENIFNALKPYEDTP